MKNLKYLALTALMAGTFGITAANAEMKHTASAMPHNKVATKGFKSLDTNKDGVLSEAEYDAHPVGTEKFSQIDANGDGTLTMAELQKAPAAMPHHAKTTPAPVKLN